MSDKGFSVRFRDGLDDDLKKATRGLSKGEKSRLARDGFRLMLGIRTTRQVEVKERQIVPPVQQQEKTVQLPGKPAVYVPNQRPKR